MKNLYTTALFLVLFTISATAAKVYQGYVVLNDDTKVEGSITMLSPSLNEVKVKFTSKDGKKVIYKAKDVKEYGFKVEQWNKTTRSHDVNTIVYVRQDVERSPIAFGPTNVLIERQLTGTINMYNHFIEQNSNAKQPFAHVVYEELTAITKSNYKVVLKEMTGEYPELSARIGTKGYGYKYVIKIINTFNNWMMENGEEVVLGMK